MQSEKISVKFHVRREEQRLGRFRIILRLIIENEGIAAANQTGNYTMKAIADEFGLHYATVSRVVKKAEK